MTTLETPKGPAAVVRLPDGRWKMAHKVIAVEEAGWLCRNIKDSHVYKNIPGVAWNYELLARAEQLDCPGLAIRHHGNVYRVSWPTVLNYATNPKYALGYREKQVVIPWPAWLEPDQGFQLNLLT